MTDHTRVSMALSGCHGARAVAGLALGLTLTGTAACPVVGSRAFAFENSSPAWSGRKWLVA
jgi:hypothetical protein